MSLSSISEGTRTESKRKYGLNENKFWDWRGQKIRYVAHGLDNTGPTVLFVHGLFVNADHFRKNLPAMEKAGYRAFAIDLLGNGLSSKPLPCEESARAISGEQNRREVIEGLQNIELGTSSGSAA
jgi:pimeloyl-ACP methyl ester carboxylesterase